VQKQKDRAEVEQKQTQSNLNAWIENMYVHHAYSMEEMRQVCGVSSSKIEAVIQRNGWKAASGAVRQKDGRLKVLPYPGGRHPRIGFLEGAIDPQRGTKASFFYLGIREAMRCWMCRKPFLVIWV
jgi:hypothetical protein